MVGTVYLRNHHRYNKREVIWLKKIREYIGAAEFAARLGTSVQNVSKAGKRAMSENYRGEFPVPDGRLGDRPLWLVETADNYVSARKLVEDYG